MARVPTTIRIIDIIPARLGHNVTVPFIQRDGGGAEGIRTHYPLACKVQTSKELIVQYYRQLAWERFVLLISVGPSKFAFLIPWGFPFVLEGLANTC